uniref:Uncharacterized protein n=1 Tax=Rhizophora mucronata TaxID=61149 RepID=A0A2P2NLF5_RHIMU
MVGEQAGLGCTNLLLIRPVGQFSQIPDWADDDWDEDTSMYPAISSVVLKSFAFVSVLDP